MNENRELDLRVRRTYRSLAQAFTALLAEARYEDITVSDLCEAAMIRRTTFYKHFADKHEFFVFYVRYTRDEFQRSVEADPAEDATEYLSQMARRLIAFFTQHERLVDSALASNLFGTMCDMLIEEMSRELRHVVVESARATGAGQLELECTAAFLAGGIVEAMRTWWQNRASDPDGTRIGETLSAIYASIIRA